jgi:hypothetical protein
MRQLRDILADDLILLGGAAELCNGSERAVELALQRVQVVRRDLQDVEARLRTTLQIISSGDR